MMEVEKHVTIMSTPDDNKKLTTILSIDGGGIRGIIPATILEFLEEELQKLDGNPEARIADYFDVIAGTSTGGVMAAMLVTPAEESKRPAPAKCINDFYFNEGPEIFSKKAKLKRAFSLDWGRPESWYKLLWPVATWLAAKMQMPVYDGVHLRKKVEEVVGARLLAHTHPRVVIPAYDIERLSPVIFSTDQAKKDKSNVKLVDVVMSSSAAPYYFRPNKFSADGNEHRLIDGGVVANNPTLVAVREASKLLKTENTSSSSGGDDDDNDEDPQPDCRNFIILSLGTGLAERQGGHRIDKGGPWEWVLEWVFNLGMGVPPLLDVIFRANNAMVEAYTSFILGTKNYEENYLRIQDSTLKINEATLDNATTTNLDRLKQIGKDLLDRPVLRTGLRVPNPRALSQKDSKLSKSGTTETNRGALLRFARRLSAMRKLKYDVNEKSGSTVDPTVHLTHDRGM